MEAPFIAKRPMTRNYLVIILVMVIVTITNNEVNIY